MASSQLVTALRDAAKPVVFAAAASAPRLARRLRRLREAEVVTILNLHRVAPDDRSAYPPLDPALFEDLLDFVGAEFSVVPLAELAEPASRPKLVLSFDDGYRDFVDHALPALKRRGIKPNQNLIPRCLETGLPPLNVLVQDFIGQAPQELSARLDVPGFEGARPQRLATELSDFIRFSPASRQAELNASLLPQLLEWEEFAPTPMMSASDVRSAAGDVEFGAHSYAHASMSLESDAYLRDDLQECRRYFESELGLPMTIYAFPNGSFRENQIDIVRSAGVDHVLLVGEDFDRDPAVHRRFTFTASSPAEVRFKAAGGFAAP